MLTREPLINTSTATWSVDLNVHVAGCVEEAAHWLIDTLTCH